MEQLYFLIKHYLAGDYNVTTFCEEYERIYNFEYDGSRSAELNEMFRNVFAIVTWYSPYADERKKISNYKSENDVLNVAQEAILVIEKYIHNYNQ